MNSAKNNSDLGACSHAVHDFSTSFSADISRAKNGEFLIVVYSTRLRFTHTPCLSTELHLRFSYRMKINESFHPILKTQIHRLL